MILDVLIFDSHPDDAELSMGGTIIKLTREKYKVGVIDLTNAELSTRGNINLRKKEAIEASRRLNLTLRENLKIPDGNIVYTRTNLAKLIKVIRKYRPRLIFAPYFNDRHPDHIQTSKLVKDACFFSGLSRYPVGTKSGDLPHRPLRLFYFLQTYTVEPSFIVDISETFEEKMMAIKAYSSQFFNPESKEPETLISQQNFLHFIEARAVFYGFKIGRTFGEPFFCEESIEFDITGSLKLI